MDDGDRDEIDARQIAERGRECGAERVAKCVPECSIKVVVKCAR